MSVDERVDAAVVAAAQAGDEQALDELVARHLPLVYNLVGRALNGHPDVDDVVQETMLRVVHGIDALRDPTRFRSWLVTIALRQINDRWRARQSGPMSLNALGPGREVPDPNADFVELTITRLGLSGERREVAEATAWLDLEDRRVLSLWWLEAAGELTRAELTAALGLSAAHAAVRVQRVKNQLTTARGVVRALSRKPRCPELAEILERWDGGPSALWRKRISRHSRDCTNCGTRSARMTPAEALLAGIGMIPPPSAVAAHIPMSLGASSAGIVIHPHATAAAVHPGRLARILKLAAAKPGAAIAATALTATGAAVAYMVYPAPQPHSIVSTPTPQASTTTTTPTQPPSPLPTTASTSQSATLQSFVYGSVVDEAEVAPPRGQKPRALTLRPTGTPITATGKYVPTSSSNRYLLQHNGEYLTLRGQGYLMIRWQIVYTAGRVGQIAMPTWTGLSGKLFHVASGGSRRMDDVLSGSGSSASTGMGSPSTGFDTVPTGAQQMWQNEYYYLDGTVVLHQNQGWAEAGFIVEPTTSQQITTDVNTSPGSAGWVLRYGLVRDTGNDDAPVPQYATRGNPINPADVPQHSEVE